MSKVIYDFGMNNGDDIEYYLQKGLKVVGVEANPKLYAICAERFAHSIDNGQLTILNVALVGESSSPQITFYVHKTNNMLSQVLQPDPSSIADFEPIQVSQKRASEIIIEHGPADYIKIDLEGMDHVIIADIFGAGIFPDFISAESHSVDAFALFVSHGYNSFNLIDGASVHKIYDHAKVATPRGKIEYSFKHHSAGPYGEDIISPWVDKSSFLYVLALAELGWKDVHASRLIDPKLRPQVSMKCLFKEKVKLSFTEHLDDLIPSFIRALKSRLKLNGAYKALLPSWSAGVDEPLGHAYINCPNFGDFRGPQGT